jgi:hypothetical protein
MDRVYEDCPDAWFVHRATSRRRLMRQSNERHLRDIGNVCIVEVTATAHGEHRGVPETSSASPAAHRPRTSSGF